MIESGQGKGPGSPVLDTGINLLLAISDLGFEASSSQKGKRSVWQERTSGNASRRMQTRFCTGRWSRMASRSRWLPGPTQVLIARRRKSLLIPDDLGNDLERDWRASGGELPYTDSAVQQCHRLRTAAGERGSGGIWRQLLLCPIFEFQPDPRPRIRSTVPASRESATPSSKCFRTTSPAFWSIIACSGCLGRARLSPTSIPGISPSLTMSFRAALSSRGLPRLSPPSKSIIRCFG
jgi:hypothetical protein